MDGAPAEPFARPSAEASEITEIESMPSSPRAAPVQSTAPAPAAVAAPQQPAPPALEVVEVESLPTTPRASARAGEVTEIESIPSSPTAAAAAATLASPAAAAANTEGGSPVAAAHELPSPPPPKPLSQKSLEVRKQAVGSVARRTTSVVDADGKLDADDWTTLDDLPDATDKTFLQPEEKVPATMEVPRAPPAVPRAATAPESLGPSAYVAAASELQRGLGGAAAPTKVPSLPMAPIGAAGAAREVAQGGPSFFTPRVATGASLAAVRDADYAPPHPGCMVSLIIRELDALVPDALVTAPVVRVHLVDAATGAYVSKSNPSRTAVTARHAPPHIEPFQTSPYVLGDNTKPNSSGVTSDVMVARWNEELVIDEDWDNLLSPTSSALALFEVLQPAGSYDAYRNMRGAFRSRDGAYPVAWGFLRLRPKGGVKKHGDVNIKLREWTRSASYKAVGSTSKPPGVYDEYRAYCNAAHKDFMPSDENVPPKSNGLFSCVCAPAVAEAYPGVLRIRLTAMPRPSGRARVDRAMWPFQEEQGRLTVEQLLAGGRLPAPRKTAEEEGMELAEVAGSEPKIDPRVHLRRGLGEPCQVPNRRAGFLDSGLTGASALAFSPDGSVIAAAIGDADTSFSIRLYSTATLKLEATLEPHYDMVYDMRWSKTGTELISASSDFTAKVWNVAMAPEGGVGPVEVLRGRGSARAVMQHAGFVYAAAWVDEASAGSNLEDGRHVLTSCYDGALRLWDATTTGMASVVADLQLGVGTDAYGNALAMTPSGSRAYLGCADGHIREVGIDVGGGVEAGGRASQLTLLRTFAGLGGAPIAALAMHPNGEEMAALSHASALVTINLTTMEGGRPFWGVQCSSHRPAATQALSISPDGAWLLAGSEDGRCIIWSWTSGESATLFGIDLKGQPLDSLCWSPTEHVIAVGAFGSAVEPEVHDWSPQIAEAAQSLLDSEARFKRGGPRPALLPLHLPAAPPKQRKRLHLPDKLTPAMVRSMLAKVREDERGMGKSTAPVPDPEVQPMPPQSSAFSARPSSRSSIPRLRPTKGAVSAKLEARKAEAVPSAPASASLPAAAPSSSLGFGGGNSDGALAARRPPFSGMGAGGSQAGGSGVSSGSVSQPPVVDDSGSRTTAGTIVAPSQGGRAAGRIMARLDEMKAKAAARASARYDD